jgi:hypothetical protein
MRVDEHMEASSNIHLVKADAEHLEEMLKSRAWRLVEGRLAVQLRRDREMNESDMPPGFDRERLLGHIQALKVALTIPRVMIDEARNMED